MDDSVFYDAFSASYPSRGGRMRSTNERSETRVGISFPDVAALIRATTTIIVIAGLDPAIHLLEESFFDGCAGRARA
jgi:hypothetical protein